MQGFVASSHLNYTRIVNEFLMNFYLFMGENDWFKGLKGNFFVYVWKFCGGLSGCEVLSLILDFLDFHVNFGKFV